METTATVDGHRIFFRQEGQRGLPIVFLHGVPTSHHKWRPVQHLLVPYLQNYTIDIIGMAEATRPWRAGATRSPTTPGVLAALMDEWGHEQMVVVGDDCGGALR